MYSENRAHSKTMEELCRKKLKVEHLMLKLERPWISRMTLKRKKGVYLNTLKAIITKQCSHSTVFLSTLSFTLAIKSYLFIATIFPNDSIDLMIIFVTMHIITVTFFVI